MEDLSILSITIEDEMRQSYMDYAMSVIVGRALPDVRDGLKPVQRRVLYAMYREGLLSNRKHSKCAGVVGEVLKRYHPHGDAPVYEALVRLAQSWSLRYPLVDGQGNFGSIDGDPPAAYRYTESRMTPIAEKLLEDIDKETVDFIPNFDDSHTEPTVFPAVVPNLLINGASGIAVGMATHMPPHNLIEIIDALVLLIDEPNCSVEQLLACVPGPDFPTGGIILGTSSFRAAYRSGKGVVQVRGKADIEKIKGNSREVEAIVITEIPFQVNKARLIERIAELVNAKEIEGISKLRDESDRHGMRIVIELKRDATAEVVLNQLYKSTPLQTSFGIINLAIVEGKPVICSLRQLLEHFLNHRRDVVTRRTTYELRQARARMHLLEGFRIALLNIDEVIAIIKGADSPVEAREVLQSRFSFSQLQAQAILDLRLQKLTGLERLAIEREYEELKAEIERLSAILESPIRIDEVIRRETLVLRDQFTSPRRTQIIDTPDELVIEDFIEDEEMVVTISHQGYIRRTSIAEYRAQKRGGKGIAGVATRDEDFVEHLFVASTHASLLAFTTLGRLHWLKVYEIPEASRIGRGRALVNLLDLRDGEGVATILSVREFDDQRFVMMATKQGVVKKIPLMEFSKSRRGGVIACVLDDNDVLIAVDLVREGDDVLLATQSGLSIRFPESDVRAMGRVARGVKGIELSENDFLVSMTVLFGTTGSTALASKPELSSQANSLVSGESLNNKEINKSSDGMLVTVCEFGYGKRTPLSDYRSQKRSGKGIIDIQAGIGTRNGLVVSAVAEYQENAEFMLITSGGKIIRLRTADVPVIGRNTLGVRLINLEADEKVVAVAHFVNDQEEDSTSEVS
jgi:DNA gyrase subunit A